MSGSIDVPLAHSACSDDSDPDPYARHVAAVRAGARDRATEMLRFSTRADGTDVLNVLDAAATYHDLGKLDPEIQAALRRGRGQRLKWDHVDAGVAHLMAVGACMSAWLVRAHHAPGLPEKANHFGPDKDIVRQLRGRRNDADSHERHETQKAHTDGLLRTYLQTHHSVVADAPPIVRKGSHGLTMRLLLSCLVDADHTDTAAFDSGPQSLKPPATRWAERLEALCRYVADLPAGETEEERDRNKRRSKFFDACLDSPIDDPMAACEGPVGLGKTTAVAAYLLRRARDENLRRLIIVAPFTNILSQTADRLRRAVVLDGEDPNQVIVEHHHRADFSELADREMAVLWQAPIVLTTAVSFFESLAACHPGSLRKLHSVPGSAIFLDEAHAALPTHLWSQNFEWLTELANDWSCRFIFASGSLVRFWESSAGIVSTPIEMKDLLPRGQAANVFEAEKRRIRFERLGGGQVVTVHGLLERIEEQPGPRLVILNTVQNAAVVARAFRNQQRDVLHLSTALTPSDRETILAEITRRLKCDGLTDWTLVATSCVEAGVDLSFRTAFRERFSASSMIQTGGRVNRHGQHDATGGGLVFDFALEGDGITNHPSATTSAGILRELLKANSLNTKSPAEVVTYAMKQEVSRSGGLAMDLLRKAERERNYPETATRGRVITADTRIVIIDHSIRKRLLHHEKVATRELLSGSVQLWSTRIQQLAIEPIWPESDLYFWNDVYDPDFLGYMEGVLRLHEFLEGGTVII
ncbi:MAG: CRISPR-associated helicase/endonuclease Cas3 [Fuerstiella sp.]